MSVCAQKKVAYLSAATFTGTMWPFLIPRRLQWLIHPGFIYQTLNCGCVLLHCIIVLVTHRVLMSKMSKQKNFSTTPKMEFQWRKCGLGVCNYFWFCSSQGYNFFEWFERHCLEGRKRCLLLLPSCCLAVSVITWLHAWLIGSSLTNQHSLILCWWVIHVLHGLQPA